MFCYIVNDTTQTTQKPSKRQDQSSTTDMYIMSNAKPSSVLNVYKKKITDHVKDLTSITHFPHNKNHEKESRGSWNKQMIVILRCVFAMGNLVKIATCRVTRVTLNKIRI